MKRIPYVLLRSAYSTCRRFLIQPYPAQVAMTPAADRATIRLSAAALRKGGLSGLAHEVCIIFQS